jgi:hypothetical protein
VHLKGVRRDGSTRPHALHQLVVSDQATPTLNHDLDDLECAPADGYRDPIGPQLAPPKIDFQLLIGVDNLRGHYSTISNHARQRAPASKIYNVSALFRRPSAYKLSQQVDPESSRSMGRLNRGSQIVEQLWRDIT